MSHCVDFLCTPRACCHGETYHLTNYCKWPINQCKMASKTQYNKYVQAPQRPLSLGSHVYVKPCPSQRGNTCIHGQVIDHTAPPPYSINMGSSILRFNRAQLHPAAPPKHPAPQPLALPLMQATSQHKPAQQPSIVPLPIKQPIPPPTTWPEQQDQ